MHMADPITVLWLVDESQLPKVRDERFRHVIGDPARPAATVASLLADGGVLAVVRTEAEGQLAIAHGADEIVLASECSGLSFDSVVDRTTARARARQQRDLFLIDLVRKDDTSALELLAAALGEELLEPLFRAKKESDGLVAGLETGDEPGRRIHTIADSVASAARVVERMRDLVSTEPTDEVVDLAAVARDVAQSLAPAVRRVAHLDVEIVERECCVGLPRWQLVMTVASLIANAVESVAARGGDRRRVSVRVCDQDGAAVLEVADDGVGMAQHVRPYVGDPFFTTTGKGRLGLGLTVASARIRRAGGELMIESDPGVGTTVRVFLPTGVSR
jgi:hypothetical protein